MKKNEKELLEQLQDLEAKLVEVLESAGVSFDENTADKETKIILETYIKKVRKAEKLFDQYEKVASQIEKLSANEDKGKELSEAVVELGDKNKEDEIEVVSSNGPVLIRKKKKNKNSVKEF